VVLAPNQKHQLFFFFFLLEFGLSRLTSLQFIQYHVAGFYKLTILQSSPSHFAGLQQQKHQLTKTLTERNYTFATKKKN
jgi:hypothetical protein